MQPINMMIFYHRDKNQKKKKKIDVLETDITTV